MRTRMFASIEHKSQYYAKIGRSKKEWLLSAAVSQLQTQQGSVRMIFIIHLIPARICNCCNIDAIWLNIIFATPAQKFVCWIIHMWCWSSITRLCCQDLLAQVWAVDTSICFVCEKLSHWHPRKKDYSDMCIQQNEGASTLLPFSVSKASWPWKWR